MADEAKGGAASAVAVAEESNAADQAELDALLGGEGTTDGKGTATVEEADEPAGTEEADDAASKGAEEAEESEADEAAAAGEEEAEEEETELSLEESDRDYSDEAYKKAAAFYSKKLKVQFDPNDPKDRVTLSRLLKDKEALAAQRAELDAKAAKTDEDEADEEGKDGAGEPVVAKPPTAEQIQGAITGIQTFAKTRVVPQVALHLSNRLGKALWGKDFESFPQEQANEITEVFTEMLYHGLNDALPFIIEKNFDAMDKNPILNRVSNMAVREGAFEHLDSLKDGAGKQLYPDLERMVDAGEIQAALKANPWIGKSNFDEKDPIRREAKRIEAAYKIARGEKVVPQVTEAVATGKRNAEAAARARGAARVAPGRTKGSFGQPPSESETVVKHITTSNRGRFSRALTEGKDKSA